MKKVAILSLVAVTSALCWAGERQTAPAMPAGEQRLEVTLGQAFVREVPGFSRASLNAAELAQTFVEQRLPSPAPLRWRRLASQTTRLGTWVRFDLLAGETPVLRRGVQVHVNTEGVVDRLSGHLPRAHVAPAHRLSPQQALLAAAGQGPRFAPLDPSVARAPGTVGRAYLDRGDELRPVYLVYPRSLHPLERYEIIVDAISGTVLASRNRVTFADRPVCANVFAPTPGDNIDPGDAVETVLPFAHVDEQGYLVGDFFQTFNCCPQVGCDPQGEPSRVQGQFPNPAGFGPNPIYYDMVMCDEHPRAQSLDGDLRYDPIDPPPGADNYDEALADPFAEPHIYFSAQNLLSYIRRIGDPQFLLRANQGSGGVPSAPFHLTANLVVPDFNQAMQQLIPPPFGPGQGTQSNPVIIDDYLRIANAAYMPASTPGNQPIPIDLFNRDFDSVVFFQGERRDFGYDGDVVFHELTHAVIGSTANLAGALLDEQGSSAAPGALNEAYADYFAASLSNDSVTGEYAGYESGEEGGIRDANNGRACPGDLTGEVHDDSWPWSGALWDLRNIFVGDDCDRERFDAAIYDALIGLPQEASYDVAAEATALALTQTYGRDSGAYAMAHCIFLQRGMMNCDRSLPLLGVSGAGASISTPIDTLYLHGGPDVGLAEAPSQMQLRMDLPAGASEVILHWSEGSGGAASFMGGSPSFEVLIKRGAPIRYTYAAGQFQHDADQRLTVTRSGGGIGQPSTVQPVVISVDATCGATYWIAFINGGATAVISGLEASVEVDPDLAASCDGPSEILPPPAPIDPPSCQTLPTQVNDSQSCNFGYPHEPQACPQPEPEPEPTAPTTEQGCECRGGSPSLNGFLGLPILLLMLRRRRFLLHP